MAIDIADLTLAEVVRHLIAGDALQVSGGVEFSLPLPDSRTVLAFYNQNRQAYWNPDKDTNILDGEIHRLLDSLDEPVVGSPPTVRPSTSHKRWLLVGVTAHRFRGLHRHCDEAGRDPVAFTLDFSRDATLFRGFSGAGKTSRMSAICWCLTGYGHRSKDFPLLCIFRSIFRSRATTIPAPMPDLNCRLSCRSRPKRNYSRSMANEGRHMGSPQVSIAGGWQRGGGRTSSRTGRQEKLRGKRMNSP